jgi:hypothetical protein
MTATPSPAPFTLYSTPEKTKSPKTAEISRPFQGFSRKTKGYVEKYPIHTTFSARGKIFFSSAHRYFDDQK